jgi:O-antigen/teichoic acid export membrane protein
MIFAPLLTRLYGPEPFGQLGMFTAMVAVMAPLAALAYPIAIVLPRNENDAGGLARLSIYLSLAVATLVAGAIWLGHGSVAALLGFEAIGSYVLLVPLALLFSAWLQIAQQWLIRRKQFSLNARVAVFQTLTVNSAKAILGWIYPYALTLILLTVLGHAVHAAILAVWAKKESSSIPTDSVNSAPAAPLGALALRYSEFPRYRAPQNLINAASHSVPLLMLAAFFGAAAAGFYALAKMVMGMPSVLVGRSVGDAFYPRVTEASRSGEDLSLLILKATGALAIVGVVPFSVVVLFGPWLFGIVFGSEWSSAGEYARWLAFFFFFNFINKPSVAAVPVLGIQRGLLIYELFSTGGKAMGVFIGFYIYGSDLVAVGLFSLTGVIAYACMILWIVRHARAYVNHGEASR